MSRFAFCSSGGYARDTTIEFVQSISRAAQYAPRFNFIDDDPHQRSTMIPGAEVIFYKDAKSIADRRINRAFAEPELRRTRVAQCEADGFFTSDANHPRLTLVRMFQSMRELFSLISPRSLAMPRSGKPFIAISILTLLTTVLSGTSSLLLPLGLASMVG